MRRIIGVSFVLLSMLGAPGLHAQAPPSGQQASGFQLHQNYPNPFNPETRIPFELGEDLFVDGRSAVVSMRIFNLLQQQVAVPVALRHPMGEGVPLNELEYARPGRFEAFWDGRNSSGRQVPSGAYFLQLTVNGLSKVMKMFVMK